jgi:cytochrome bd-type quinol oxidase subunit 2
MKKSLSIISLTASLFLWVVPFLVFKMYRYSSVSSCGSGECEAGWVMYYVMEMILFSLAMAVAISSLIALFKNKEGKIYAILSLISLVLFFILVFIFGIFPFIALA